MSGEWTVIKYGPPDTTAQFESYEAASGYVHSQFADIQASLMNQTAYGSPNLEGNSQGFIARLEVHGIMPKPRVIATYELTRGPIDWNEAGEKVKRWAEERKIW